MGRNPINITLHRSRTNLCPRADHTFLKSEFWKNLSLGIEQEKSERVHTVYTVWIPLSGFLFLKVFPEPTFREV